MSDNEKGRIGLVRAVVFVTVCFLLVAGAIVFPYLRALEEASRFAVDTRDTHLPEMLERQRTVTNVEKLARYAWIVSETRDPAERRKARLAAQIISTDALFERSPQIFENVSQSYKDIRRIEELRDRQDAARLDLAKISQKVAGDAGALIESVSSGAVRLALDAKLAGLRQAFAELSVLSHFEEAERSKERCRANLSGMLAGLGDVPVGARQTPPARIAWELEQVFLFSDAYFIYDKEIAGLREKVDSRIGEISDAISQAASASASDIATHIVDDSRQARLVSFWGLLVLGVMVLCLALLFRAHILKPILWSTDGLDIAEKEGRPVTLPQARMKELQAIADAVVRLSHVLSFQREANTDLETRVRERTAELEAAKLSLEMDIEARKKVEAALRESEERYRGLLGAWPDPTIVRDPEGVVTYVNDAFERTYGWRREEVLGKPLHAVMPEEEDLPSLPALQDLSEMVDSEPNETHRRTKDGHSLIVRINVAVLRDTLGKQVASLAIHRDVTRHVAMEAYIAQTQKMEAIGTLAGGIAHDFNNILTAVTGFTQYALSKTREPEVQEDLQAVLLSSKRATELVRQILTFSRQRPQQEAQPVQVKLLVKEGLNFLRASIPATIQMQQNIESESSVLANPSEIQRILVNLCTNAALAMGDEGGVLKVSLEDVELDAAFVANNWDVVPGRYLRLTVSDTGCGMTAEVKERIFEPFYTTRADGQGSGLGLSVVHGIVKARNGTVSVASEPGKGSTFEVYLPVVKQEGVADVEAYEASEPGTERILFVDDELTIVLMTEKMLGHLGYEVSGFTSSLKALEVFRSDPRAFDLVISDLTMPGLTGDVLAERIRALRPDIPVILCTGYDEKRMVEKAENLGIDEFVIKPVVGAQLTRLIRKVMDKS